VVVWVVCEVMVNVVKYLGVLVVDVFVECSVDVVEVFVCDCGCGFDFDCVFDDCLGLCGFVVGWME